MKQWPKEYQDMIDAGFIIGFSQNDQLAKRTTPEFPPTYRSPHFVKDTIHVWKCREGWQVAELIDGKYCNHRGGSSIVMRHDENGNNTPMPLGNRSDRFLSGFIPDLPTVLELYKNNDL